MKVAVVLLVTMLMPVVLKVMIVMMVLMLMLVTLVMIVATGVTARVDSGGAGTGDPSAVGNSDV